MFTSQKNKVRIMLRLIQQAIYNRNKTQKTKMNILSIVFVLSSLLIFGVFGQNSTCHYTCATCSDPQYFNCLTCPPNRGLETKPLTPFAGMCYCTESTDENLLGLCTSSSQFNYNNKPLIAAFIGLSLFFSLFMVIIRGFRYYFIKIIEDVQQLSLIVFINMYFPQQFDIFLTQLYRFNISSFMFESLAKGGLFMVNDEIGVLSTDGSNVNGKYKLLYKTANFFSNIFTWLVVFLILIAVTLIMRWLRNKLIQQNKQTHKVGQERVPSLLNASQSSINHIGNNQSLIISENASDFIQQSPQKGEIIREKFQIKEKKRDPYENNCKNIMIRIGNVLCFNVIIIFFYLSLIEININVFTQMTNLTFSSGFAATGAFFSALFLAVQIVALVLLFLKCRQELIKPQWMHDHTFSALHYLIRTNFKSATKYFFFFCSVKKILFALIVVVFYDSPSDSIIGLTSIQIIFLCLSIYLQPFQKRYIRIHFYLCETLKLFLFISLVNFVQKYREFTKLIDVTKILFLMFAIIFGFHLISIILTLIIQFKVYWVEMKSFIGQMTSSCSKANYKEQKVDLIQDKPVIGYYHQVHQKQQNITEPQSPKNIKQLKQNNTQLQQKFKTQHQKQEELQVQDRIKKYFYVYKEYQN